jgi:putative transposase
MTIPLHGVIKGVGADSPVAGLHRVLWKNAKTDLLCLIEIPTWKKDRPAPRYYKGPRKESLSKYEALEHKGDIVVTAVMPHPIAGWNDDQIRKRYPRREKPMKTRRVRTDCAVLQFRDERWAWVEPICKYLEECREDAFEAEELGRLVKARADEIGRKPVEIYDAVHRVLAHASGKNSILPAYCRSGGKGKSRQPRKVSRLGRVNSAFIKGEVPSPGIHLNDEHKRHLAIGHSKFVKQGLSVQDAYILTMGAWWSSGTRIDDGIEVPVLRPAHERPTLAQFRYWGPRDPEGKSAFELLLKDGEWEKKYRSMVGAAMHGLNGVGQMGVMDATGTHVTFVSMASMLDAAGPGHRIVIHDGLTETITGFYVGLEAPGERTVNLAVYNSVIDKVDVFARFGLRITSDQVPACYYRKIRLDNGESRNAGFMQLGAAAGSALEFVERGRAERKQQAESGHRSIHVILEDRLDGATRGKSPERGEDHSAIPACWTWYDYMVEFLRAVIYFNCNADASSVMARHPFRTEMERDGILPRRAAMYAWCVKNNRIGIPAHDIDIIRAKLLPTYRAVVKQSGVYLYRPDRGDKPELVVGPRYTGRRTIELGWHEGKRPDFAIDVRMDPDSPNRIWYADEMGIHALDNQSDDETAKREATLHDYLAMQDGRLRRNIVAQTDADQARSDFISHRENKNLALRQAKRDEIKKAGAKISKQRLKSDIKPNRAREASVLAAMIDPITRAPKHRKSEPVSPTRSGPEVCDSGGSTAVPQVHATQPAALRFPSSAASGVGQGVPEFTGSAAAGAVVADALAALRARRRQEA